MACRFPAPAEHSFDIILLTPSPHALLERVQACAPRKKFRFRNNLAKQRDHLLTFLDEPQAGATNNLAERQLRGAVIARKLSCGNKTARGPAAWQTLASLAATCSQRSSDFVAFLAPRLRLASEGLNRYNIFLKFMLVKKHLDTLA